MKGQSLFLFSLLFVDAVVAQAAGAWIEVPMATRPFARENHSMVYDHQRGEIVLFGGSNGSYLNDTWTLDAQGWSLRSTPVAPPPREFAGMAYDPVRAVVVLIGGSDGADLDDVWEWDGNAWSQRATGVAGITGGGSACYDPIQGGVFWNRSSINRLWNGTSMQNVNVAQPSGTSNADMVFHAGSGGVIRRKGSWTQRFTVPAGWENISLQQVFSVSGYAIAHDPVRNRVFLHGGDGQVGSGSGSGMGRTWMWNGTLWSQLTWQNPLLSRHEMVFDPVRDTFVIFGGYRNGGTLQDKTYVWQDDPPPAEFETFGVGCSGAASAVPALDADPLWNAAPELGGVWFVRISDAPVGAFALGVIGLSSSVTSGVPLPLDLAVLGMNGCSLLVSPDDVLPLGPADASGAVSWATTIPVAVSFAGLEIFQQAALLEPTANPGGIIWSNGGRGTLGS